MFGRIRDVCSDTYVRCSYPENGPRELHTRETVRNAHGMTGSVEALWCLSLQDTLRFTGIAKVPLRR